MPRGHLDVMFQLGYFLGQFQEIGAIETERFDRRAATNRRGSRSAFGQRGFAETVARLEGGEDDFVAGLIRLDDARASRDEDIERVRRFALPNEKIAELVTFLLQELAQFLEGLVWQELKERRTAQEALVGCFHFVRLIRPGRGAIECGGW